MLKGTTGLLNLHVPCVVGIYDHERKGPQPLYVDIEVDYDWSLAVATDEMVHGVDYDGLAATITQVAQDGRFALLETLIVRCAEACLKNFPVLTSVRLTVRKPEAVPAANASFVRFAMDR